MLAVESGEQNLIVGGVLWRSNIVGMVVYSLVILFAMIMCDDRCIGGVLRWQVQLRFFRI